MALFNANAKLNVGLILAIVVLCFSACSTSESNSLPFSGENEDQIDTDGDLDSYEHGDRSELENENGDVEEYNENLEDELEDAETEEELEPEAEEEDQVEFPECAPEHCSGIDCWVFEAGVTIVPLNLFPDEDVERLKVEVAGQKANITLYQSSEGLRVLAYIPGRRQAHSEELHFFASLDESDPSSIIAVRPENTSNSLERADRIIRRCVMTDRDYWAIYHRGPDGEFTDCWASERIRQGQVYSKVLSGFDLESRAVSLELELWGASVSSHVVAVRVNGVQIGVARFEGMGTYNGGFELAEMSANEDGEFILELELDDDSDPANGFNFANGALYIRDTVRPDGEMLVLTSFEEGPLDLQFDYPEGELWAWDISDPPHPLYIHLEASDEHLVLHDFEPGNTYLLFDPSLVHEPDGAFAAPPDETILHQQGDLITICPEQWQSQLEPLLAKRREEGWTPVLRAPRELYALFTRGEPNPYAITAYISHASMNWSDYRPRAVLLVGDSSPDIHGVYETRREPTIPTHYYWWPSSMVWVPSDVLLVRGNMTRDGSNTDPIAVGRIPARTEAQLSASISRVMQYGEAFNNVFLYVSDDNEGIFKEISEETRALLPPDYDSMALHMEDYNIQYPLPDPPPEQQHDEPASVAIRRDFAAAMLAGLKVVQYFGHGDLDQMAGERIIAQKEDFNNVAEILVHGGSPPVFLIYNCLNGYFSHPKAISSLAESMLLQENAGSGAAAVISTSAYGNPAQTVHFSMLIQNALVGGDVSSFGEAFARAVDLMVNPPAGAEWEEDQAVLTYNYLGDPTLPVFSIPER